MMDEKLRPLFLIKPGTMSRKDIGRAERMCGICIAECSDTDSARYSEPPLGADLNEQSRAALSLMRKVLSSPSADFKRGELTKWFVEEILTWQRPANVPAVKGAAKP
jgi:hypothetical protein